MKYSYFGHFYKYPPVVYCISSPVRLRMCLAICRHIKNAKKRLTQRAMVTRVAPFAVVVVVAVILYNILVPSISLSQNTPYSWLFSGNENTPITTERTYGFPTIEKARFNVVTTYWSQVTVYHSVPEQTDSDPFTTASGEKVHDGIVAANCLPFGTLLRMPELFGDKIFIVKDRLAAHKTCYIIDIWQEFHPDAQSFGAPITKIEILSTGKVLASS